MKAKKKIVKKVKDPNALTAKQEVFCYEYCIDFNATRAAKVAGYAKNTAKSTGSENLTKPDIQKRIQHMKAHLAETAGISALKIVNEHQKIAFSNAGQLRSGWLTLKNFEQLTPEQKACIQEISTKQVKIKDAAGVEIQAFEEWVKIKLYDKQKSLDSLANILGFNAATDLKLNFDNMTESALDLIIEKLTKHE